VTETVTVTPAAGIDSDGNPANTGDPVVLTPLEVAPGNLLVRHGVGGDLTGVEFTVYLPLRVRFEGAWTSTEDLVRTGDDILVRGKQCTALVSVWRTQHGGRGGVAVLARSATGKAA
jgi:hypothetical protein